MAGLSRSQLAVWLTLFRLVDARSDTATASVACLAGRAGCNRSTALRALRGLERLGLVRAVRRGGLGRGASVYRLRAAPREP